VLASAAVAVAAAVPYFEDIVSRSVHRTPTMVCEVNRPDMADGPEGGEPEPTQTQRPNTVIASSSNVVVHLEASSLATRAGKLGTPPLA
jgi:hypothetical protein